MKNHNFFLCFLSPFANLAKEKQIGYFLNLVLGKYRFGDREFKYHSEHACMIEDRWLSCFDGKLQYDVCMLNTK